MKKIIFIVLSIMLIFLLITGIYNSLKPLPEGINFEGESHIINNDDIIFLYDLTYLENNQIFYKQKIFNTIYKLIDEAEKYILIDMFLFNPHKGKSKKDFIKISKILTEKLIEKKINNPDIKIDFITDPINTVYGGAISDEIERLKKAEINVVITNLNRLRDSNPIYSSIWRIFIKWSGNSKKMRVLNHPFSSNQKKVSIRSYLSLLNFKANHRKVFVTDNDNNMTSLITSANPHDASSYHSNVAFLIKGDIYKDIYYTENTIAKISKNKLGNFKMHKKEINQKETNIKVKLITEKKIKDQIIELIDNSKKNDKISIAMFYLSERGVIKKLLKASKRGVKIKLILDPNKDAFGYKKNGIPNRPVANELIKKTKGNIKIKWYDTHGEQFHTKLLFFQNKKETDIILGSANITKRNINNFNLEMDLMITGNNNSSIANEVDEYFQTIWNNNNNKLYTVEYNKYKDESFLHFLIYRIQEFTGVCSF
jgi:HKD family nuclease